MRPKLVGVLTASLFLSTAAAGQSLTISGTPALLQPITFTVTGPPGAWVLIAGSPNPGPTSFGVLGNFDIGLPFAFLVAPSPDYAFVPAIGPNGSASFTFAIPLYTPLIGLTTYLQAVYEDGLAPYGIGKTNGVSFTIADPYYAPTVSSVAPTSGPSGGGTVLTITGSNFQAGTTTATLGGVPLQSVQVVSATQLTATTPGGPVGSALPLIVTTLQGGPSYLPNAFTYLPTAPTLLSVSPDHAPTSGGTVVTVTGTGLGVGTSLFINGAFVLPITQSATSFTGIVQGAPVPGFATLVAVSAAGFAQSSTLFRYVVPVDAGDGSDGAFEPTANVNLDTTINGGVFNFTTVNVPVGVVVTASGPNPLRIRVQGPVLIEGELRGDGSSTASHVGGAGGPGGGDGGVGGVGVGATGLNGIGLGGGVAGAGGNWGGGGSFGTLSTLNGTSTYGSNDLTPLVGGSGGAGGPAQVHNCTNPNSSMWVNGPGGGGGGGAISIVSDGDVVVSGQLSCRGGSGGLLAPISGCTGSQSVGGPGSGGAVRIESSGNVFVAGTVSVEGAALTNPMFGAQTHFGGNGRWYIRNWLGQSFSGTTATVPVATY